MNRLLFYCVLISSLSATILAVNPTVKESKVQKIEQAEESSHVTEILQEIGDREIQTPQVEPKSPVVVWLTSFGISCLYKMHAVKDWFATKILRKTNE